MWKQELSAIRVRSDQGNRVLARIAASMAHMPTAPRRSSRRVLGPILNQFYAILDYVRIKSFALIPRQKHVNQCIHELSMEAVELEIKLIELEAKLKR